MKTMVARYSMPDNIPDYIKGLPEGAQRIFVEAFNASLERDSDEDKARQAGWGAVKTTYVQQGDEWVRKASEVTVLRYVSMIGEVPAEGTNESRVQVFRTGTFRHPIYGKFTITDSDLETMVANFKAHRPKAPTELAVDYEHMSAIGNQVAPAAGWVKGIDHIIGELWATVSWTDKAAGMIRAKEYRFISPEWHMQYKDKESGADIGACLLSMALTNRPFIEGMQPVMLSESLEESNSKVLMLSEKMLGLFMPQASLQAADWDQQYINDLPDEAFAFIESGGEKDELGKTVPRALRHLPYRNVSGSINLDHLRNALARLDQTSLSQEGKTEARRKLEAAAKEAGVGEAGEEARDQNIAQEVFPMEEQIRELLGLGPDDDIIAAITALKAKAEGATEAETAKTEAETAKEAAETKLTATETRLQAVESKVAAGEVAADVDKALRDGHILPKQVDWAKSLRAKDPEGFKAFVASAPKIGPAGTIIGVEGDDPEAIQLTEAEEETGKRLGVSPEATLAQKKEDAKARKG